MQERQLALFRAVAPNYLTWRRDSPESTLVEWLHRPDQVTLSAAQQPFCHLLPCNFGVCSCAPLHLCLYGPACSSLESIISLQTRAGRMSKRRCKHVLHSALQDDVQPPTGRQGIVRALGSRGGNHVEVRCLQPEWQGLHL